MVSLPDSLAGTSLSGHMQTHRSTSPARRVATTAFDFSVTARIESAETAARDGRWDDAIEHAVEALGLVKLSEAGVYA